jgi:hypothetical protein
VSEICGLPFPGTIGAETHCEHYYADGEDLAEGPCCWCGSEEDEGDYPACPAVSSAERERRLTVAADEYGGQPAGQAGADGDGGGGVVKGIPLLRASIRQAESFNDSLLTTINVRTKTLTALLDLLDEYRNVGSGPALRKADAKYDALHGDPDV